MLDECPSTPDTVYLQINLWPRSLVVRGAPRRVIHDEPRGGAAGSIPAAFLQSDFRAGQLDLWSDAFTTGFGR
jgi:hypothetical protein